MTSSIPGIPDYVKGWMDADGIEVKKWESTEYDDKTAESTLTFQAKCEYFQNRLGTALRIRESELEENPYIHNMTLTAKNITLWSSINDVNPDQLQTFCKVLYVIASILTLGLFAAFDQLNGHCRKDALYTFKNRLNYSTPSDIRFVKEYILWENGSTIQHTTTDYFPEIVVS